MSASPGGFLAEAAPDEFDHLHRRSLNAQIAATGVMIRDARDRLQRLLDHDAQLWDALANAQRLP